MSSILEMFNYSFIIRAFVGGTIFALAAPLVGQIMLLRGYSGISDGIGHISLLGIAISIISSFDNQWIAIIITIILSLGMEYIRRSWGVRSETSIVIFVTLSLAIITLLQELVGFSQSLESLLFGSIITITETDIWRILIITIITYFWVVWNYKSLVNALIDPISAKMYGVRIVIIDYLLIAITASLIVVGINIIGALLMGALMIIPVASSMQFGLNFKGTHIISVFLAMVSVWIGIILSWTLNLPGGSAIALVSISIFILSIGTRLLKF